MTEIMQGPLPNQLANAVSDAIHEALERGMQCDEAVSIALKVASDYGRTEYGDEYLNGLAELMMRFRFLPVGGANISKATP